MHNYKKTLVITTCMVAAIVLALTPVVQSHCEIPCGIYDDSMRINMMYEHVQTIEKSMNQINTLSKASEKDFNQIVRWTVNKENHSDELSDIVTQYFMKQRIKPAAKDDHDAYTAYVNKLTLLHEIMVYSMKCKQTTDLENVNNLRETITKFKKAYSGEVAADHSHSH